MATVQWRSDMRTVRPMLATLEDAPLEGDGLVYEPKYDGIRALVEIMPGQQPPVRLWSRLGNEKTAQFPDLVAALTRFAKKAERSRSSSMARSSRSTSTANPLDFNGCRTAFI